MANVIFNLDALESFKNEHIDVAKLGDNLIKGQLEQIRSRLELSQGDTQTEQTDEYRKWGILTESYCHAFYRVLGLPVISKDQYNFYNPGFVGLPQTPSEEKDRRSSIDKSQDPALLQWEQNREFLCSVNLLIFQNPATRLNYMLDMMTSPIAINMLDSNITDPFTPDTGQVKANYGNRVKFPTVSKILRPFKCVPIITNDIAPLTNKICAPFVLGKDANVYQTPLTRPYIELVARIRFASDVASYTSTNKFKTAIQDKMSALGILDKFLKNIQGFSDIEAYTFYQLFVSFVSICRSIKQIMTDNSKLANNINALVQQGGTAEFDKTGEATTISNLDREIANTESEKAARELILSQMPIDNSNVDTTRLQNTISCLLNNTFISLVSGDIKSIQKQLTDLQQQKSTQLRLFNSINKNSFYTLGEVTGIGLIDIMALMMSFWLVPQDQLLAMFDGPTFQRLYMEPKLRNSVVQARYQNNKFDYSSVSIAQALTSMDNSVLNLLGVASSIVDLSKAK